MIHFFMTIASGAFAAILVSIAIVCCGALYSIFRDIIKGEIK